MIKIIVNNYFVFDQLLRGFKNMASIYTSHLFRPDNFF